MPLSTLHLHAINDDDVRTAGNILRAGGLVAIPTETVYGLAADATNPDAVSRIFAAKGRPATHPLIVHIGEIQTLYQWAANVPDVALSLAAAFWPGPLTLLLPRNPAANPVVAGGLDTIGLRMPAHPVTLRLLRDTGLSVAAPSANPHLRLSPTTAQQVLETMSGTIGAVLDGGPCEIGLESTILDLTQSPPRIVRAGPLSARELSRAAGTNIADFAAHTQAVPGNMRRHYQPRTPLFMSRAEQLARDIGNADGRLGTLFYSDTWESTLQTLPSTQATIQATIRLSGQAEDYARGLYDSLYQLDKMNLDAIWVESPPQTEDWRAVHDRLSRACQI